jgi:hypothetical protein
MGGETTFLNRYRCPCGHKWADVWSCACNDKCPNCNREIEPYQSTEVEDEDGETDHDD